MDAIAAPLLPATLEGMLLFVGCGDWPIGIEGRLVQRLVMPEAVQLNTLETGELESHSELPGFLGYCHCDGRKYSAWDLGSMLEMKPAYSAWVLIELEWKRGMLSLALRTGPAMGFARADAGRLMSYAPWLSRQRPGAITGIFNTRLVPSRIRSGAKLGVKIDLASLWTSAELDAIAAAAGPSGSPAFDALALKER